MNIKSKRVFVAIKVPPAPSLIQVQKKLRMNADKKNVDCRWVPKDLFHITLNFLGQQTDEEIQQTIQLLKEVAGQVPRFSLPLRHIGAFPDVSQARVIWAGVQNKIALRELQQVVATAPSEFEFVPHVTLARIRNPKNIRDLISPFVRAKFGKVDVDRLVLFESVLQGNFPKYIALEEFPLG